MKPGSGGLGTAKIPEAARRAQHGALSAAGAAITALDRVTFEDVAVGFSLEEWSLLEGSQKDLHQEVMLELCSLLLSLGHSVPSLDFSSLTCQPDGTAQSPPPSWRRWMPLAAGSDQIRREEPPFPGGMEGPDSLEPDKAEEHLAATSDEEGKDQSSHHLCALMKLVNEIPEFLCGHTHTSLDRSTPAGGSESRGHTVVQLKTSPSFRRLEPLADLASLSVSSPAGTPSSSPEGEWSEPTPQGTFAPCSTQGWKGTDAVTNVGLSTKENLAEEQPKSKEGVRHPRLSMEQKDSPPMEPRLDTDDSSADSSFLDQPRSCRDGGTERAISPGLSRSNSEANGQSEDRKMVPKATAEKELPKSSHKSSPKLGPEAASEEKPPLHGLLKCLKDLVTLQSGRGPQRSLKASTGRQPRIPGVGRWGGRSASLPIQVKTEASGEESGACNSREGLQFSVTTRGDPSIIPQPEGCRRVISPGGKEEDNFPAVKMEQGTSSSPCQDLRGDLALATVRTSGSPEKAQDRPGISAVRVKSEEEHPLRGPEDILEEKSYHHFDHLRSSLSPGSKLGLWVPYSAEWSPATSPLNGLLNCLKDIPVPRPLPPQILPAKRGATGEKERRRGGRRGRFGPPSDACPPQGSEASLGEKPAQQSFRCQGYANRPHERETVGRKGETVAGQEDLGIMKERSPSAHIQPASPAVNLSVSSSPDCLPWWTPEPMRWRRKEDELSQSQSPLQSLGKGFKETPLGSPSWASSPATSRSPDGFQRWPSGPMQRARREEGLGQSSTPLQGLEKCLKDIQNQRWSPAVTSSMHSSPDRLCQWTPEPALWVRREGGGSPARVPPLQGLENCLKEIAPRREFLTASGPSGRSICTPKRPGMEEAHSPRPWPAGNLPPPCASALEEAAENSPLHRLMNCLKEIPIQRPSYLNPPSTFSCSSSSSSSSSSSCSEIERDQQSPGNSTWWDRSQGRPQLPGPKRDALVGRKVTMEPKRKHPSTQLPAEEEEQLSSTQEANFADRVNEASSASLLGHPQNDAKDTADVKQMFPSTHPLRRSRAQQNVMSRSSEAREDGPPSTFLVHKIFTREQQKSPRGTAPVQTPTCFSPLSHNSQDGTPEGDTDWSPGEEQIQPQPGDKEAGTGSSPLQGLLRCLKEITYPSAPSPCPSSAGKRPRESRYTQEEEEEEEAAHCKKKSWQSAVPSSSPIFDAEIRGTQLNGHSHSPNTRTSAHKQSEPPRWSPSVSFRTDTQRTSATAADKGNLPVPEAGPEAKKRPHEAAHLCHCAHGAEPGFSQPLLSKQLGRLAADVNGLCRDLSSLQSHVWHLEQEARGWALELAALHLENRHLAKYARRLESRCQVLETRSRRLNLRLSGLPEGVEGGDPVAFLRRTLPEVLGWSSGRPALEIESARRVGGRDSTAKPRPVLFRLLRSADKAAVLEAARTRPLRFAEAQLAILPDLGAPRRRPPLSPFRRSRWVVNLLLGGQPPTPWGLGRGPAWREPPVPCTPLAAKAAPETLGSHAQHNP